MDSILHIYRYGLFLHAQTHYFGNEISVLDISIKSYNLKISDYMNKTVMWMFTQIQKWQRNGCHKGQAS